MIAYSFDHVPEHLWVSIDYMYCDGDVEVTRGLRMMKAACEQIWNVTHQRRHVVKSQSPVLLPDVNTALRVTIDHAPFQTSEKPPLNAHYPDDVQAQAFTMAAPQKQGSRWGLGSLVSGAVAGLESRLDTILADDETRAAEEAARKAKAAALRPAILKADTADSSRASSRNRASDRLAEKLAKRETARATGTRTPVEIGSPRPSITIARDSVEVRLENVASEIKGEETVEEEGRKSIAADSTLPQMRPDEATITTTNAMETEAKPSLEVQNSASARPSTESLSVRPSNDSFSVHAPAIQEKPILRRSPSFLESELSRVTKTQDENTRNYQEELHAHLERIDALQAKLAYLASQTSAAAREAASSAPSGSTEKKLAEQEEKIAQLLEEGQKLSKTEMKHMTAIKKMRQRMQEEEKDKAELKRRLHKTEQEWTDQRDRLRILEERDKAAQERLKILPKLEQEVESLKREKETSDREALELRKQLVESERRAEDAERRAQTDKLEDQMRVVAELNDELSNARIEKRLVEDRGKAEVKKVQEESARQAEKARQLELELRNDVQVSLSRISSKKSLSDNRFRIWKPNSNSSAPGPKNRPQLQRPQIKQSYCVK